MKKILATFILMILTVFSLAACTEKSTTEKEKTKPNKVESNSNFPITIKHAKGETVIEKMPERIVAGDFMVLDHLFALDVVPVATGHVKLAEGFPIYQPYLKENKDIVALSNDWSTPLDYEKLLAAKPDLIITYDWAEIDYEKASKIAPTIVLEAGMNKKLDGEDTDDFSRTFEQVAKAVGKEDAYKEFMEDFNNKIEETNKLVNDNGLNSKTTLFIMAGEKSYDVRDHIFYFSKLGLKPIESLHGANLKNYQIDLETLVKSNPDILFIAENYNNRTGAVEKLLANEAFKQTNAAKNNQVYTIDTAAFGPAALGKSYGVEIINESLSK
ncbi:MAG: transporter substrate-binding protein [Bacillales bacterium]|jgi:iron complex transport system substrate-binding protein|nr:transporter substrate-binding protein [Bacillales bacterium]